MTTVAAPRYQRKAGRVIPPRASPSPVPARSRSRSATPSGPRCKHCGSKNFIHEEGAVICGDCGVVSEQDGNFRAEIEFDESSSGAVKTRGTHIGANQSHSKTNYVNRVGGSHVGHEASKAYDRARQEAEQTFRMYAVNLRINDGEVKRAERLFQMAYSRHFYRGRTLESMAVVCLWVAVRQAKSSDKYPLMLIDFAELGNGMYSVFELGKMVKDLTRLLYLNDFRSEWKRIEDQKIGRSQVEREHLMAEQAELTSLKTNPRLHEIIMNQQDPEDLIERFCDKLDFGDAIHTVKRDAAKVAKSMNRDWMATGRRPAGIAGAAVIIAARMNNFRRTLREVVLVAKVTEITLGKRIEEFKETSSSQMSVKDFRAADSTNETPGEAQNPPSYYRAQPEWQEKKKSRKRKRKNGKAAETAAGIENGEEGEGDSATETETETNADTGNGDQENGNDDEVEQPPAKRPRVDADGFVVPELPVRSAATPTSPAEGTTATEEQPPKKKIGKPKGAKNWRPRPPTEEELASEQELSEDIQDQLRRNATLDPTGTIAQSDEPLEAPVSGSGVTDIYPAPRHSEGIGPSVDGNIGNTNTVPIDKPLEPDEFEDDPDVANCILNETERRIKETIWVTENADWLRTEHAKKIKQELKDRELREKGIDPEKERQRKLKRKDGLNRSGRSGDVAYLEEHRKRDQQEGIPGAKDGDQIDEQRKRRETSQRAHNSVNAMFKQRGVLSRRVDYAQLSKAYALPGVHDSESRSESPADDEASFFKPHGPRRDASEIRRAKDTARKIASAVVSYDTDTDFEGRLDRCRSGSAALIEQDKSNGDEDAEFERDEGTPESSAIAAARAVPNASARQLSTPRAHQSQSYATVRQTSQGPRALPIIIEDDGGRSRSDSPLSSTHTPAGYGSGAPNTPQAIQAQARSQAQDVEEDEEADDDDYWDEDADDDPDKYFGGGGGDEYAAGGEAIIGGEEEVVDDEI